MGVEKFNTRRGIPTTFMSDNGMNFFGAQKELLACIESWNKLARAVFVQKGIKWTFNPPNASQHGGSWERLVRSVKHGMYGLLGNRRITEEFLGTTLCLVEQSFNATPITYASFNPLDLEALTQELLYWVNTQRVFRRQVLKKTSTVRSRTLERNHTLTQYGHVRYGNMFLPSIRGQSGKPLRC